MPNDLAPETVSKAEADLQAQLAAERAARIQTERMMSSRPAERRPAEPDALPDFVKETGLKPEQAAQLHKSITQRVSGAVNSAVAQVRKEMDEKAGATAMQSALDIAIASNPDIAADPEKFRAAAAVVDTTNLRTPGDVVRASVTKYRQLFGDKKKTEAPVPDFVEGASDPSRAVGVSKKVADEKKEPEVNPLAELYGMEDVPVISAGPNLQEDLKKMTNDYVNAKMDYFIDRDVRTFMPKVAGPMRRRRKERAATAAGK